MFNKGYMLKLKKEGIASYIKIRHTIVTCTLRTPAGEDIPQLQAGTSLLNWGS
jgi:hypothetical protein